MGLTQSCTSCTSDSDGSGNFSDKTIVLKFKLFEDKMRAEKLPEAAVPPVAPPKSEAEDAAAAAAVAIYQKAQRESLQAHKQAVAEKPTLQLSRSEGDADPSPGLSSGLLSSISAPPLRCGGRARGSASVAPRAAPRMRYSIFLMRARNCCVPAVRRTSRTPCHPM